MRVLSFLLFITLYPPLYGQKVNKNYNTNIEKAQKVDIKDGVITIKKADTVIIKIYTSLNTKTKLYLVSNKEVKDSTGQYITSIIIKNPDLSEYNDVNISLKFNKPVESIDWGIRMAFKMSIKESFDKKEWGLTMQKCFCENGISITIKSKERVLVSIYGIDGNL